MTGMTFVLSGPIRPYTRMTQKSKWVNPAAVRYIGDQGRIKGEILEEMSRHHWQMIERGTPLGVHVVIQATGRLHCRDLDNELKAVLDALQGVALEDDRWVDQASAYRRLGDIDVVVVQVCRLAK